MAGAVLTAAPASLAHAVPSLRTVPEFVWPVLLLAGAVALFTYSVVRALRQRQKPTRVPSRSGRLRQMAEMATGGVLICDGERIVVANKAMQSFLAGGPPLEGGALSHVLPGWTPDGIPDEGETEAHAAGPDGPIAVRLSKRTISHRDRPFTVVTVSDQRGRLRHEAELQRVQTTDALTGLVNRTRFQALVAERFASLEQPNLAQPGPSSFALLLLGLDRFKSVNDSMGQAAGDELLVRFAARLTTVPTGAIAIGRLAGDQFGLLLEPGDPARVQALGSNLVDILASWLRSDGGAPGVGVSAGFALAPFHAADEGSLGTCAELALRRAKADGKGNCRAYETGLAEQTRDKHGLALSLRRAVAAGQLEVHFQPQADLVTGAYDGAEALLRWRHPERGALQPSEFLPIAEETGLIDEIGEWVLRTACEAASGWADHLRVAVNLSALQFSRPDLAETVGRILARTGFAPSRLELEVTESVLVRDEQRTLRTLQQLRAMGIRIALDDFGTGYSSLSYLRRFPFDKLKLDKSFIRRAPDDEGDAAIVTAILALGHSLGMATTAEGIETERQRAFVASKGCTQGQGWLFGRPAATDRLPDAFYKRSIVVPATCPAA